MAITVRCASCNQTYQVRETLAGTSVVCKECGARVQVPLPGKASSADNDTEEGYSVPGVPLPEESPPRPKVQKSAALYDSASESSLIVDGTVQVLRIGKMMWESKMTFANREPLYRIPSGKTAANYLNEAVAEAASTFRLQFVPPPSIFGETAADGMGTSALTFEAA